MSKLLENVEQNKIKRPEGVTNDDSVLLEQFDVGMVSHQGDVMIVGIKSIPRCRKLRENRQVADGDTKGSRHIVEHGDVYDCDKEAVARAIAKATICPKHPKGIKVDSEYIGPVFVGSGRPDQLTHPEHGNQGFREGQVCAVVYQRNMDAEERAQRARD